MPYYYYTEIINCHSQVKRSLQDVINWNHTSHNHVKWDNSCKNYSKSISLQRYLLLCGANQNTYTSNCPNKPIFPTTDFKCKKEATSIQFSSVSVHQIRLCSIKEWKMENNRFYLCQNSSQESEVLQMLLMN